MEDEDCGEMVLPMTPRTGLNTNADEDRCSEELMTPRSLSKRLEKPDIKVMLATGNNEPIDVMRGRGIVTSMTLKCLSTVGVIGETFSLAEPRNRTASKPQMQPCCDLGGASEMLIEASPHLHPTYPGGFWGVIGCIVPSDEPSGM